MTAECSKENILALVHDINALVARHSAKICTHHLAYHFLGNAVAALMHDADTFEKFIEQTNFLIEMLNIHTNTAAMLNKINLPTSVGETLH